MKITIEITKRYTFTAEVPNQDAGEMLTDQLLNGSRKLNYPVTLPDGVQFAGATVDGGIIFIKLA